MPDHPNRFRTGSPVTSSDLNSIGAASDRNRNLAGGTRAAGRQTRAGFALGVTRGVEPFLAKISGSANPYGWTRAHFAPGGGVTYGPETGTSNAYEVNGFTVLEGSVQRLYPDGYGGYRFQAIQWGTSSTTTCTTPSVKTFAVKVCSLVYPGATVTVTGPVSGTGTTNSSGIWAFTATKPGSYSWTVTAPNCVTATGTFGVNCAYPYDVTIYVNLTPASGYTCTQSCCTTTSPLPSQIVAIPSALYVDDGFGTVTCPIVGSGDSYTGAFYRGVGTRSKLDGAYDCVNGVYVPGPANVDIFFVVDCTGGVHLGYAGCAGSPYTSCGGSYNVPIPLAGQGHYGCGCGFDGAICGGCGSGPDGTYTAPNCPTTTVSRSGTYTIPHPIPGSGVQCYGFNNLGQIYSGRNANGDIVFGITVTS